MARSNMSTDIAANRQRILCLDSEKNKDEVKMTQMILSING